MPVTIVLADDHGIVRRGLRALIEEQPDLRVVGEGENGRDAVTLCTELRPEIAVLDVGMPLLNGIEAASQISKSNPATRIIILSMHADETYVLRSLNAGAKGYLLKDSAEDDLVRAIRTVLTGRSYFSPAIADLLLEDYMQYLRQRNIEDSYDRLTSREREVLQMLAEGQSNKEVAAILDLSLSTVDTHRTNLMSKLNLHNTAELVLYAVRKKIIR
jgi:DNA-binding NarL/FixJ family response regulator